MIFVDTGAWFSRYVREDSDHAAAVAWFSSPGDILFTTDYIIDELLTLLKVRGHAEVAFAVGGAFLTGQACHLEFIQPVDVEKAWAIFSQRRDKGWSFTDCTSLAVMQRLNITTACAFDNHFRQFGNILVLP